MLPVTLHFQTLGESRLPPLLILHGLFGSGRNWQSIARQLAKHWQVFIPDMRNHGHSPHSNTMTFQAMAADIARFMEQHHIVGCPVIAHSMGGKAACYLALTQPNLLSSLVVVDIAPMPYAHDFDEVLDAMQSLPLAEIKTRKLADELLATSLNSSSLRQFLLQNMSLVKGQASWRIDLDIIRQSIPDMVSFPALDGLVPYPLPCLFVVGAESDYFVPPAHALVTRLFPQSKVSVIEQAGHWLHAEKPAQFLAQVVPFLTS